MLFPKPSLETQLRTIQVSQKFPTAAEKTALALRLSERRARVFYLNRRFVCGALPATDSETTFLN